MISSRAVTVEFPLSKPSADDNGKEHRFTRGSLYGSGDKAVILSNMDTNSREEWDPVVAELLPLGCLVLTYDYIGFNSDQSSVLSDALRFIREQGARKIVLAGASRGGVASIRVACDRRGDSSIVGVAAMSAPIVHEGVTFYTEEELMKIEVPKLLINSEADDGTGDALKMHGLFRDPKQLRIFSGDGHGTQIIEQHGEAPVKLISEFSERVFSNRD